MDDITVICKGFSDAIHVISILLNQQMLRQIQDSAFL